MTRTSIAEATETLPALLQRVREGDTVVIEDDGAAVAQITPPISEDEARLQRLERAGILKRGRKKLPPDFWDKPLPSSGGVNVVDFVIEERRSGR